MEDPLLIELYNRMLRTSTDSEFTLGWQSAFDELAKLIVKPPANQTKLIDMIDHAMGKHYFLYGYFSLLPELKRLFTEQHNVRYYIVEDRHLNLDLPRLYDDMVSVSTLPALNADFAKCTDGLCYTRSNRAVYAHGEYITAEEALAAAAKKFPGANIVNTPCKEIVGLRFLTKLNMETLSD